MLARAHAAPFRRIVGDQVQMEFLRDPDGRIVAFLERLLRLTRRLEGCERRLVREALRRQERRVRDASRMAGIAKSLLDACTFRPAPGAARAADVRDALFTARGALWPPLTGDERLPYETAGLMLDVPADEIARLLYSDAPAAYLLERVPALDAPALLDRYNVDLARTVLFDATAVTLTVRGGWRGIFRSVKLARLMYTLERAGRTRRSYRLTLTGPAAPFLARPQRYGARFARVVPALVRAPGWRLNAEIIEGNRRVRFELDPRSLPVRPRRGRPRYDSAWERALAHEFAQKIGSGRGGWTLTREDTPVTAGGSTVFLPDFTFRHLDGREALVEIVGFWTPEYLEEKLGKLRDARLENLVLVVYQGLAAGAAKPLDFVASDERPVVWFKDRPRIGPVMAAVERVARRIR